MWRKVILQNYWRSSSYTWSCRIEGKQNGRAMPACSWMAPTCHAEREALTNHDTLFNLPICPHFWFSLPPDECASSLGSWLICTKIPLPFGVSPNCNGAGIECCHAEKLLQNLVKNSMGSKRHPFLQDTSMMQKDQTWVPGLCRPLKLRSAYPQIWPRGVFLEGRNGHFLFQLCSWFQFPCCLSSYPLNTPKGGKDLEDTGALFLVFTASGRAWVDAVKAGLIWQSLSVPGRSDSQG